MESGNRNMIISDINNHPEQAGMFIFPMFHFYDHPDFPVNWNEWL
jgi:hypothetical protein